MNELMLEFKAYTRIYDLVMSGTLSAQELWLAGKENSHWERMARLRHHTRVLMDVYRVNVLEMELLTRGHAVP